MKHRSLATSAIVLGLAAGTAQAQTHTGTVVIDGSLCVGFDCPTSPAMGFDTIRLQENNLRIHFDDTSTGNFPSNDWRLVANSSSNGGDSFFGIQNVTGNRYPFYVSSGARANALYIDGQGDVGIGTTTPATDIEIKIGDSPTLRLQQDGTSGFTPQTWDVAGNETNFFIRDVTNGSKLPFRIRPDAPTSSIEIEANGDIGMGETSPDGKLHTKGAGVQLIYFESSNNDAVQVRMRTDSENRRFLATNSADAVQSQIVFNNNSIHLAGATNSGANLWAVIDATGITTLGPDCSGSPCDRTFDPDYFQVPSIEEHAEYMWDNMHLKAVGPTGPDQPYNVTQKTAGMLHELEVAHIYIAQQQDVIKGMGADITALTARLAQLEDQIQD